MVVPEHILVREALHCCQGINGRYVWWQGNGEVESGFSTGPGSEIPPSQRVLISRVTEVGWVLRKILDLQTALRAGPTCVQQALVAAAQVEVNCYYRLIAILESQSTGNDLNAPPGETETGLPASKPWDSARLGAPSPSPLGGTSTPSGRLTLRRLDVWLSEPLQRLRVVASALEAAKGATASQALDSLQTLAQHGDPAIRRVAVPLLDAAAVPWLRRVVKWVLRGELDDEGALFAAAAGPGTLGMGAGLGSEKDLAGPPTNPSTLVRDAPYADAFLIACDARTAAKASPASLWADAFSLDLTACPSLVPAHLAEQLLLGGKSVRFLRVACGDGAWAEALPRAGEGARALASGALGSARALGWLARGAEDVCATAGARALAVVMGEPGRFLASGVDSAPGGILSGRSPRSEAFPRADCSQSGALPEHLAAIRAYLLLARGDFAKALLERAAPELDRPAKAVSLYALQGHVDAALRACGAEAEHWAGSNARAYHPSPAPTAHPPPARGAPPSVNGPPLQVRLARALEGDRGWDVFSLAHAVSGPAGAVLRPDSLAGYVRCFRLLWAAARADHALGEAWRALRDAQRGCQKLRALEREHGVEVAGAEEVSPLLRAWNARWSEMSQFVRGLHLYLVVGVIEPAWARFAHALAAARDLDTVIGVHDRLLADLARGMFLDGGGAMGAAGDAARLASGTAASSSSGGDVQAALRAALRSLADVAAPAARVAALVEGALAAQKGYLAAVAASEAAGRWTDDVLSSPAVPQGEILALRGDLWQAGASFERQFRTLLALLPGGTSLDLRAFLTAGHEALGG